MDFEDILLEVGDYGKFQKHLIMFFFIPAATLLPWFTMNVLFMVSVPDHWCRVPELDSLNMTMTQRRAIISPPEEHCHRYDINYTFVDDLLNFTIPENFTTRPCDQGWEFDHTYYDKTIATQWNMYCDDAHYTSFVLSLYNIGSIIGTPIYGAMSDRIGRKYTFFICVFVTAVSAVASVAITNFTGFVIAKTINGFLMPSIFQIPYIIVLELVSPEMRTRMNGFVNLAWTVGMCLLPLIAYYSRTWVILGIVTSIVIVTFFFYYALLPESPRWLVSQERYEEAATIMYKIGEKNGKLPEKTSLTQKLQKLGEKLKKEKLEDGVKNTSTDLLRYPQLRKTFFIITFCWMANIMSYYGLQMNISNLAGNEFVNFFLLSVAETPGYLTSWYFMNKYGRRWCSVIGFLLTGTVCMIPALGLPNVDVICSLVGKFCGAGTFMATYQQSSELYPTVVRSVGMSMSSTIALTATLFVPYFVYLGMYGKAIPFVIIGCFGIVAGILAAFLPETLNEHLPQSIFDAEEFGKNHRFFTCRKRRRSLSRERAASIAQTFKGMDILGLSGEDQPKSQRSSQILQNVEFTPGLEKSVGNTGSVKYLNGGASKRNSTDSHLKENCAMQTVASSNRGNSISKDYNRSDSKASETLESERSFDDRSDKFSRGASARSSATDDNKAASAHTESIHNDEKTKTDEKFSYVNMVFDNNNDVIDQSDVMAGGEKTASGSEDSKKI